MKRPRLLDLFCGQGGAGMGYHRAGFDVVGVDINPQPRYPFEFHQGDALEHLAAHGGEFDAVHASPPCQDHSSLKSLHALRGTADLLPRTRTALEKLGKPWVIENVVGADMPDALTLCGAAFGLTVDCKDGVTRVLRRHRLFESSEFLMGNGCACDTRQRPGVNGQRIIGVYGNGGGGQMTRGYKGNKLESLEVMGTPWMDRAGVSQAIPPAYTEFVGEQLLTHLRAAA